MNEVTELEGAGSLGKTPFCPFLTIQANISLPTLEGREIFFPQTAFPVHKQKKKKNPCPAFLGSRKGSEKELEPF